jgi:acetyl-CoA C-acetyltransferase
MSKYSSGVYSAVPADWSGNNRFDLLPEAKDHVEPGTPEVERASVETYTIHHTKKGAEAIWIGRDESGGRVAGNADLADEATRALFEAGEPFGDTLKVTRDDRGRNIGRLALRAGL